MKPSEAFEITRHRVCLWGRVRNAEGEGIPGALVTLLSGSDARQHPANRAPQKRQAHRGEGSTALSRHDGIYFFFDLPPGEYTVAAELAEPNKRVLKGARVERAQDRRLSEAVDLTFPGS